MPTFGFEAEFGSQSNIQDLVDALARSGLVHDNEVHSYHCECRACDFTRSAYVFRVQSDSSCGGEVISRPFDNMEEARIFMDMLEKAAIETDSEPGLDAGFHVHVKPNSSTIETRATNFFAFGLWEPILREVGAGRFLRLRDMNRVIRSMLNNEVALLVGLDYYTDSDCLWLAAMDHDPEAWFSLYEAQYSSDRHTTLNVRTRYDTWEFRLWNSTRAAWRMQMFSELSLALVDTQVTTKLATTRPESPHVLADIIDQAGHPTELLRRQIDFVRSGLATNDDFIVAA